jgi:hypothetical protein
MEASISDLVAQHEIRQFEIMAKATGNPKMLQTVAALRTEVIPPRTPSMLDTVQSANARAIETIDSVIDDMMENAKHPATAVTAGLSDDTMRALRSAYNETQIMATEMSRRGRDFALLDYADRRYLDPVMQLVFPWHYWWSRSIPNWAAMVAGRPDLASKYMHFQRELKQYTRQDPNTPEWAQEDVPIRVPGYPGTLYWNYDSAFNAFRQIVDTFEDEDRTHDTFGKILQTLGNVGPAPHPILMAAYAAVRGLQGDTAGLRSYGHLSQHTKMFTTFTGITLEPWLWLRDPVTGEPQVFTGGTKWDIEKAVSSIGRDIREGRIGPEAGILAAATHVGSDFENALRNIQVSDPNARTTLESLAGYRRLPTILSSILGLRISVRQDWENEQAELQAHYTALKEAGEETQAQAYLDANPWMSATWMSYDNDHMRMEMLANSVFSRIPPMPSTQRQALMEKAGLSDFTISRFYDDRKAAKLAAKKAGTHYEQSPLAGWDRRDYNKFTDAILNMAEIIGIPSPELAGEWRTARKQWSSINDALDVKYPGVRETESMYFQVRDAQGKEAAKEFLRVNRELAEYWRDRNHSLLKAPMVLKYYKDPMTIDTIAESLAYESVEERFGPNIFDIRRQYQSIPDDDWWAKREFRRQFPQYQQSYDFQREAWLGHIKGLSQLREDVIEDRGAPETISYIVDNRPNEGQQLLLNFIEEMALEAQAPPPPIEIPPEKWSPSDKMYFKVKDAAYAKAVGKFPNLPTLQNEYERIKRVYGDDSAKLFAQQAGIYKMWDAITLGELNHPLTFRAMKADRLGFAAKALIRREADVLWPGLLTIVENEYYMIPKARKSERKAWRKRHPSYISYLNWKDGAENHYMRRLTEEHKRLQMIDPDRLTLDSEGQPSWI